MKNIKTYTAPKYNNSEYNEIEPGIYQTLEPEFDNCLSLEQVMDQEELEEIKSLTGWVKGETALEESYWCIEHNKKRYYKKIGDEKSIIYKNQADEKKPIYVTSILFEQEPEFDENNPFDKEISQYPLEDILDKFMCFCSDFYEKENANDRIYSYVEFASDDIEDIRELLSILGKHVYNAPDGDYVKLVIE